MTAEIPHPEIHFPEYWQYKSDPLIQDPSGQETSLDRQEVVQGLGTKAARNVVAKNSSGLAFQAYPAPAVEGAVVKLPDPRGQTVTVGGHQVRTTPLELPAAERNRVYTEIQFEKAHTNAHELFADLGIQVPSREDLSEFFDLTDLKRHFQNELENDKNPLVILYSPDIKLSSFKRILRKKAEDQSHMPRKIVGVRNAEASNWIMGFGERGDFYFDEEGSARWSVGVVNQKVEKYRGKTNEWGKLSVYQYLTAQLNLVHNKEVPLDEIGCTILDWSGQRMKYGHDAFLGRWDVSKSKLAFFSGYIGTGGFEGFVGDTIQSSSLKRIEEYGGKHYRKFKSAEPIDHQDI